MPINVLPKTTPRGKGPEPSQDLQAWGGKPSQPELKLQEEDLAAKEIQDLWESQEVGLSRWSGEGDSRFSDPD